MKRLAFALLILAGCLKKEASDQPAQKTSAVERPACSAAGLSAKLPAQPELPAAVARTRQQLADAAVRCDWDALGKLADHPGFTASFGFHTSTIALWKRAEADGGAPLKRLVQLLALPSCESKAGETVLRVWPSAYCLGATPEAWQQVASVYDAKELQRMKELGSYVGYRVGIAPDGAWRFFVAGD